MRAWPFAAVCLTCLLMVLLASVAAPEALGNESVEVTSEYAYAPLMAESETKIRTLALFAAKMNAATHGAHLLEKQGFLAPLGEKKKEILCLAADKIEASVVEEETISEGGGYRIRIRARIDPKDYVQTQIVDRELEDSGHAAYRVADPVTGYGEEGIDEVVDRNVALAHQAAPVLGTAQAPGAVRRVGHLEAPRWNGLG